MTTPLNDLRSALAKLILGNHSYAGARRDAESNADRFIAAHIAPLLARITTVERERDQAIKRAERAEGDRNLARALNAVTPLAGIVEGWRNNALAAEARADRLGVELAAAREALTDAEETLRLVEHVPFVDPRHGAEVEALGRRIGFGALMSSASASWAALPGFPKGGQFVAGPCHATVLACLKRIRAALTSPEGDGKS